MLRILEDLQPLVDTNTTGIGYFTQQFSEELSKLQGVEIRGFSFGRSTTGLRTQMLPRLLYKLYTYPRYLGLEVPLDITIGTASTDVIIGSAFLIPPTLRGVHTVPVVHDLSFADHPEWVQGRNAHILRTMLPKTLARSSALITISEFSANRIRDIYQYEKPILVVSIPPKKSEAGQKRPQKIDGITPGKFFLFVSTIEPRKNIKTLLDAFEKLPGSTQSNYPLVLAGKPGWDPESLDRLRAGKNKNIYYLDYVSEAERNWLYKNATVTVIPSHYEGFGMMTLESLDAGTPTIVSNIPPQREILGDTGDYFDPLDTDTLSDLLCKYTDSAYRKRALARQSKVLKNYSWQRTALQVKDFLEKVVIT